MEILYKFKFQFFKGDFMQSDHTGQDNTSQLVILQLLEDLRVEDPVKEVEK